MSEGNGHIHTAWQKIRTWPNAQRHAAKTMLAYLQSQGKRGTTLGQCMDAIQRSHPEDTSPWQEDVDVRITDPGYAQMMADFERNAKPTAMMSGWMKEVYLYLESAGYIARTARDAKNIIGKMETSYSLTPAGEALLNKFREVSQISREPQGVTR